MYVALMEQKDSMFSAIIVIKGNTPHPEFRILPILNSGISYIDFKKIKCANDYHYYEVDAF